MPLIKSGSKEAVGSNIQEMMKAGHPQKQAIAAALNTARKYGGRYAEGGRTISDEDVPPPASIADYGAPAPQPKLAEEATAYPEWTMGNTAPAGEFPRVGPVPFEIGPKPKEERGIVSRVTEGAKHGWGHEPTIAQQYPYLAPFIAPVAAVETGLRGMGAGMGAASGLVAGIAEKLGMDRSGADKLERDLNILNQYPGNPAAPHMPGAATFAKMRAGEMAQGAGEVARGFNPIPEGAAGAFGGKLTQPTYHPMPHENGNQVLIKEPSQPTPPQTWTDPKSVATFTPEQPFKKTPILNGKPFVDYMPPEHWGDIDGTDYSFDKPFQAKPGLQPASGVIIMEPDGRVWVNSPTNKFGGYNATFPKGKLESGLTLQENAIKEAFEETGLKVKLTGLLGDFDRDTSTTRYYLAEREAGNPANMGWETQAMNLVPKDKLQAILNNKNDHSVIAALNNYGKASAQPVSARPAGPAVSPAYSQFNPVHLYDIDPAEVAKYKQIGPQNGTNSGGLYQAPDGSKSYIKVLKTPDHVRSEKLASQLYKLAGVSVPDLKISKLGGKDAIVSPIMDGSVLNQIPRTEWGKIHNLSENLPVDAWLGNYDAVGTGWDNIVVDKNNHAHRIDLGGSLRYRAQGAMKPEFGKSVTEIDTMRDPQYKYAHGVYGQIGMEDMLPAAKRVAAITDDQIRELVAKYGPIHQSQKAVDNLANTLIARRDDIAKRFGLDKHGGGTPPTNTGQSQLSKSAAAKTPSLENLPHAVEFTPEQYRAGASALWESAHGDITTAAKAIYQIAEKYGHKVADGFVAHLPYDIVPDLDAEIGAIAQRRGDPWATVEYPRTGYIHHGVNDVIDATLDRYYTGHDVGEYLEKITRYKPHSFKKELMERLEYVAKASEPEQGLGSVTFNDIRNKLQEAEQKAKKDAPSSELGSNTLSKQVNKEVDSVLDRYYAGSDVGGQVADLLHSYPASFEPLFMKRIEEAMHAFNTETAPIDFRLFQDQVKLAEDAWHEKHVKMAERDPFLADEMDYEKMLADKEQMDNAIAAGESMPKKGAVAQKLQSVRPQDVTNYLTESDKKYMYPLKIDPALKKKLGDKVNELIPFWLFKGGGVYEGIEKKYYDMQKKLQADLRTAVPKHNYPEHVKQPSKHQSEPAFFMGVQPQVGHGYGPWVHPYMGFAKNPAVINYFDTFGQHNWSPSKTNQIIKEAKARGHDVVFVTHMTDSYHNPHSHLTGNDLKESIHTQILFINTPGRLKTPHAAFKDWKTTAVHAGIAGAGVIGTGMLIHPEPAEAREEELPMQKKAGGGAVAGYTHPIKMKKGGMLNSPIPGRTDKIPVNVPAGAYVLPADIPSALGEGNSMAGAEVLKKMFSSGPYGIAPMKGRSRPPQAPRWMQAPKPFKVGKAYGGEVAEEPEDDRVPIIAAGGEYILDPEVVASIGDGDMARGHKILDKFVLDVRRKHIQTLKGLKPPKK